jgi:Trypsin-co-occurring domain 1
MTKTVKLDLDKGRGSIWIEADEPPEESSVGRGQVALGTEVAATLASAFEQFTEIFQIAQDRVSKVATEAQETSIEIAASLTTKGNLIIVKGEANASIKVTMKWAKPANTQTLGSVTAQGQAPSQ